ncbi:MAG: DUF1587 domain-containing protein [Prosthecobacter sp.]|uniref:DUF1587 domain-containing protein n=1 Tax=Prosthecobacter sp. TaxID=1965333 RepID=UPI0025F17A07|nr:DUF1587 domain-containing protein [Prosthecobacter sp.]MCF7787142.1 DUF1587 domain-containing protein [Prosthecobacter sp.]
MKHEQLIEPQRVDRRKVSESRFCLSLRPSILCGLALGVFAASVSAAPVDFGRDVRPFLDQHCVSCHGPKKEKGGVRLHTMGTISETPQFANTWLEVREQLLSGDMPPEDEKQPSEATRKAVIAWIDAEVERAQRESASTGGKVVMRRLNRSEYRETMREILHLHPAIDTALGLPDDDTFHGFDNIGSALNISSARNRVMAQAMGHPESAGSKADFPGYGSRAQHVLFLSATPIEESYTQLWNQLDVFGHGKKFPGLIDKDLTDDQRKAVAQRFLVRRVTSLKLGEEELTKNLYRREWRRGGVAVHDDPIRVTDPRQRLVLALVQKKVAEIIGHEKFGSSFQMGMLASFESFQQTALHTRARSGDADEPSNFDDSEQTESSAARQGVDVRSVNRLAKSHRRLFGQELPHPKMDALVDDLSGSWIKGEKALVFVRRIASVKDLKRKLDERYDKWLCDRLRLELPAAALPKLQWMIDRYSDENREFRDQGNDAPLADDKHEDEGGHDTFFAWFFRGKRPERVFSGARLLHRFNQKGSVYAAFFEDNHTAALLHCNAEDTLRTLSAALQHEEHFVRAELSTRARSFLTTRAKKLNRLDAFEAIQAAAVEWLAQSPGPWQESARLVIHERFTAGAPSSQTPQLPASAIDWLNLPTFFSEIRRSGREDLRAALWPEALKGDAVSRYREPALRAELLSSAARLGHGLIDLYILTIQQLNSIELGPRAEGDEDEAADGAEAADFAEDRLRISQYLDMLEAQRCTAGTRDWRCFDELADISANYDLIVDVNLPDARGTALADVRKEFGTKLLGAQQPVGGMHGSVNGRLLKQFRMPGYPLVLITTDLLQEGEDLHTFCSRIHHYGISWTPSSMEQRTGRIDRVRSHTERRLLHLQAAAPEHRLQVHFPHLEDTVEVLQVRRLLTRMNTFLRLMHEGLHVPQADERMLNVGREILRHHEPVTAITERLQTAFPVNEKDVAGTITTLARTAAQAQEMEQRFQTLRQLEGLEFEPAEQGEAGRGRIFGSVRLPTGHVQPFGLYLQSFAEHPLVRCISPVGRDLAKPQLDEVLREHDLQSARIGALDAKEDQSYDLTVEEDTLLAAAAHDLERVRHLIVRVTHDADVVEKRLLEHDKPLATFLTDLQHE